MIPYDSFSCVPLSCFLHSYLQWKTSRSSRTPVKYLRYVREPFSVKTNFACAYAVIATQTITDPSPNGRLSSIQTSVYLSPGLLQTSRRPSDPVWQKRDPSENNAWLQLSSFQWTWFRANVNFAVRCCRCNGAPVAIGPHDSLAAWSLLLTVQFNNIGISPFLQLIS